MARGGGGQSGVASAKLTLPFSPMLGMSGYYPCASTAQVMTYIKHTLTSPGHPLGYAFPALGGCHNSPRNVLYAQSYFTAGASGGGGCHGPTFPCHPDPRITAVVTAQTELQSLYLLRSQLAVVKTEQLARKMQSESVPELVAKLKDSDAGVRWLAALTLGRKRVHVEKELISRLSDPVAEVREAARRALVRLARGTDFGPFPLDSQAGIQTAAQRWTDWLALQEPVAAPHDQGHGQGTTSPSQQKQQPSTAGGQN
jgi:hypothetical protein